MKTDTNVPVEEFSTLTIRLNKVSIEGKEVEPIL